MRKTVAQLWENIFEDYNVIEKIEQDGFFKITADQIRKYKEPRLMAKFDFSRQLPKVFKENGLGILPIKNGEYVIGKFNLFETIKNTNYENIAIKKMQLPDFIETIDPDNIYSESNALNVASLSGMFKDAFDEELYETIQGKMRTNSFDFIISSKENNNKIEVNFVIRQLYYPYRHWEEKVMKEIVPVFFAYDNGIYNMFIYSFEDLYKYNSLKLNEIKRYMISSKSSETVKREIVERVDLIDDLPQEEVPLPQADSFSKVIGTLELINNDACTANDIANELEFDSRQGKYYIDALRYLELVQRGDSIGEYKLTPNGFAIVNMDIKERNKNLIELIIKHKPFYDTYKYFLDNEEMPSREQIKETIKTYIHDMSDETVNRRSSTIRGWIQWIIGAQI